MKSFLECIPCFIRQTLDSVKKITEEETIQEEVLRYVLWVASRMDMNESPPSMGQLIHRIIRNKTRIADPYTEIKQRFNQEIFSMYSELQSRIDSSFDPLETAVRFAIAGNVIDFGANSLIDQFNIHATIDRAFSERLSWDKQEFLSAVDKAQSILYLADNAGEIVFDRLLIERLPIEKITVVVRGFPILNDATITDAKEIGLTSIVNVIDNGSDAPGTILSDCSDEFVRRFEQADLIIAKGQGNYETLSEVDKNIFFVLKAKCPVIARHIGCQTGDMVFTKAKNSQAILA